MNESNYAVIDCETGGLDCKKNPITQIACMILDGYTLKEIDRFETYVKPYNNLVLEKKALEYTMVKMSDLNNGIPAGILVDLLATLFDKYIPKGKRDKNRLIAVGHNITFDLGFIGYLFNEVGSAKQKKPLSIFDYLHPQGIDTWADSKRAFGLKKETKHNLTAVSERLNIKLKNAHGAMTDVIATADVFREFTMRLRSASGTNAGETKAKARDFFEF